MPRETRWYGPCVARRCTREAPAVATRRPTRGGPEGLLGVRVVLPAPSRGDAPSRSALDETPRSLPPAPVCAHGRNASRQPATHRPPGRCPASARMEGRRTSPSRPIRPPRPVPCAPRPAAVLLPAATVPPLWHGASLPRCARGGAATVFRLAVRDAPTHPADVPPTPYTSAHRTPRGHLAQVGAKPAPPEEEVPPLPARYPALPKPPLPRPAIPPPSPFGFERRAVAADGPPVRNAAPTPPAPARWPSISLPPTHGEAKRRNHRHRPSVDDARRALHRNTETPLVHGPTRDDAAWPAHATSTRADPARGHPRAAPNRQEIPSRTMRHPWSRRPLLAAPRRRHLDGHP